MLNELARASGVSVRVLSAEEEGTLAYAGLLWTHTRAAFVALPLASLQRIALQHRLDDLGHELEACAASL